ncbi:MULTISPECIES: hypothetical protein [Flavobacteriaceae]|uniref:Uncharacterized protein n=2 Tax=Flavobacteriaceae TaxID=49546 RepID=A0A4Y8AUA0_9FLAO|nr:MULTISPECIES: hypothetical protein [Flavobacteriaceae]TEW75063.1 hypothetical protein E2488_05940 [Gramella jeungdoensis]GGK41937.1 hypothetical protein GCM10007963_07400 [Lutibacter litoralis]
MIFISKVILIIVFFIFSNYVYEKSNWNFKKISTLQYIYAAIVAIPFGLTLMYLFYNNVFVTLEFLDTRNYWEQIVLIFGFITLFFSYRIYLQDLKFDKEKKENTIEGQSIEIQLLKKYLETIENDKKIELERMSENERARIQAFKNVQERKELTQKPKPTLEQKLEAYKKIAEWTKAQKELKKTKD